MFIRKHRIKQMCTQTATPVQVEGVGGGLLDKSKSKSRAQDCLVNCSLHHPAGHLLMLPLVTSPEPRPPHCRLGPKP